MAKRRCTATVALIGDYNDQVVAHRAIPKALALAAAATGIDVQPAWTPTRELSVQAAPDIAERLRTSDAIWCVPASPYESMDGALRAIRYARENQVPFLGTCGGFQHAVIEFARNVIGLRDADHAETSPDAGALIVTPLACSLVEVSGHIHLLSGSRARALYGVDEAVEGYHCNYGFNADYQTRFEAAGMRVSGTDADGAVRAIELDGHPFYMATLFQPERSAFGGTAHPVISAFVRAASEYHERNHGIESNRPD